MFDHYPKYIKSKYEKYKSINTYSTKEQEHHHRTTTTSASFEIRDNIKVTFSREAVLGNINNKDQLIK